MASASLLYDLFVLDVVKKSDDNSTEEKRTDIDRRDDAEEVLIGEETLFETLVEEV